MINNEKARAWESADSTFAAHCARRHIPLRGTFELTPRCNFHCKMCYLHQTSEEINLRGKRELTTNEWIKIAEDAINAGTLNLMITGGEPLLRDDFATIYNEINQMGFIIGLNTNASLLDEKYYRLFSKYPPSTVSVTLYGADRETYRRITGNEGHFDNTVKGLEYLKDIPTSLDIKVTFIKDNYHKLDRIRETANRYTDRFAINYMVFKPVPGVSSEAESCRLSAKECLNIDISNRKYYYELRKKTGTENEYDPAASENDPHRDYGLDIYPEVLTCLAAKAAYWISWDGRMLPCATFDEMATEPLKEGFSEAWNRLPELFAGIRHPEECVKCEHFYTCPNCPAYFFAETGSYDTVSPYICDMVKERTKSDKQEDSRRRPQDKTAKQCKTINNTD
ncbi:MAG: radical SAM protein [Lachnospiraceae bacterium]|nr:radical SAM protein [Lachnospiraceae bacterium]